jgi:dTDP-4-dehydrorhamnose reductase
MVEALQAGKPVTLFTDQMRNPIPARVLSRACLELAMLDYRGVLHIAGAQCLSRAEFAMKMLDWWGVQERAGLRFGPGDLERWPRDCCLNISRAQALLRTPLPGVNAYLQASGSRR